MIARDKFEIRLGRRGREFRNTTPLQLQMCLRHDSKSLSALWKNPNNESSRRVFLQHYGDSVFPFS